MELITMKMDKDEAKQRADSYLALPEGSLSTEDKALLAGYLALARGEAVIDINQALLAGGLDDNGRPRLAIGRADWGWCHLHIDGAWRWDYVADRMVPRTTGTAWVTFTRSQRPHHRAWEHRVPWSLSPSVQPPNERGQRRAQVPSIPPQYRPRNYQLANHLILWEVEEWAENPAPTRDPVLLRPLQHGLAAVVAEWDLTDLERAVLATRS